MSPVSSTRIEFKSARWDQKPGTRKEGPDPGIPIKNHPEGDPDLYFFFDNATGDRSVSSTCIKSKFKG